MGSQPPKPFDPIAPENNELTRVLTQMMLGGYTQKQVENPVKHKMDPSRDTRTQISPVQRPRDILGEAMASGSGPAIPWSAGYTGALGASPETQQLVDNLLGIAGNVAEAKTAVGSRSAGLVRPPASRPAPPRIPGRPTRPDLALTQNDGGNMEWVRRQILDEGIGSDARVERIPDFPPPKDSDVGFDLNLFGTGDLPPDFTNLPEMGPGAKPADTLGRSLVPESRIEDMTPDQLTRARSDWDAEYQRALAMPDDEAAAIIAQRNKPEPGYVQDPSPELVDAMMKKPPYAKDDGLPEITIDLDEAAPAPKPAWAEDIPDEAPEPRIDFDPAKATIEERVDPFTNNASAESGQGASAEALSRIQSMAAKGQRFVRRGPGGQATPSTEDGGIGLPPGWTFGIEGPDGFTPL